MNFNSWIFRGWNHRSQNQRAVASGNDNFVANSVQAIAAICTIFSGQKHTSKSILSLLQIQFWRMNHQRVSLSMILLTLDVCCNQVANTQTTYTYTLQNSGIALLSQINGSFVFFQWTKSETCPLWHPKNDRSNCHVLRQGSQLRWRKLDTRNKSNDKKTLAYLCFVWPHCILSMILVEDHLPINRLPCFFKALQHQGPWWLLEFGVASIPTTTNLGKKHLFTSILGLSGTSGNFFVLESWKTHIETNIELERYEKKTVAENLGMWKRWYLDSDTKLPAFDSIVLELCWKNHMEWFGGM